MILNFILDFDDSSWYSLKIFIELFYSHGKITFLMYLILPSCIKSQFLWFSKDVRTSNNPFHFKDLFKQKTLTLLDNWLHLLVI